MKFNEHDMTLEITFEDPDTDEEKSFTVPAVFEVCERCQGKGTHTNPAIDGNGLTARDFAEDPDFKEDYFSGVFDVACEECHGNRVVPVINYDRVPKEVQGLLDAEEERQSEMAKEAYYNESVYRAEMGMM